MVIVPILFAFYGLADLVIDKLEGTGAENVLLVPPRVPIENFFFVDEVKWIGERGQERAGGEFEVEDDSLRVWSFNFVDH